jgi:hypothetical protein
MLSPTIYRVSIYCDLKMRRLGRVENNDIIVDKQVATKVKKKPL